MDGTNLFLAPYPSTLGQYWPCQCLQKLIKKYKKNEFATYFAQIFTINSYKIINKHIFGFVKKLMKDEVYLWKEDKLFFFLQGVQITNDHFWISKKFRNKHLVFIFKVEKVNQINSNLFHIFVNMRIFKMVITNFLLFISDS